jgi:hypothetical protein
MAKVGNSSTLTRNHHKPMKTRLIPLIVAICFGSSLAVFSAPPPKKKPAPKDKVIVPIPVPVPVPVVPPVVKPPVVKPPVVLPPKPPGPAVRFCGVERAHAAHQFRGRGGILYRCPGKVIGPGPRGPIRR